LPKILLLFLPTLLSITAYCLPLILVAVSILSPGFVNKTEKTGLVFIAFLLILAGRIISLYSVLQIRKNNRQAGKSFELKTGNIFSFSRNPILLGMYITYMGMIILFPFWFMLAGFAVYAGNMHFRILIEESFLRHKFGNNYINYQEQTKRYL
jgi:protein-S-isoprenylcysteine O-methyltransferase Ste14